jgi:anti-sigma regulatory factor (Ser/Thr protein kinase)
MADGRLTLRVPNQLAVIERLANAVDAFCSDHAIPPPLAVNLNLALDEILTNIISYGFKDDGRHDIEVELRLDAGTLAVDVVDDGVAFDPLKMPPPDLDAALEDRPIGGLGIHLVKSLMDSVEYRREGERNRLSLRKNVLPPDPASG